MAQLDILAIIVAKEDKRELVLSELKKLIPITRQEDGCIKYELFADDKNPNRFIFEEIWESAEKLEVHKNSSHMANYVEATKGAVELFDVIKLIPVN
ncbi:hypothetical protein AN641_04550 [Candidatus Epulonipiscioides gigas]|nr:hypothetical protein AN641_04550 [Epulopiscium sp. SCG-C07WGA-EpuloA2]